MRAAAIDLYVAAFLARCEALSSPGRPRVQAPGVCGLLAGSEDPRIRVLVTDDRAHAALAALLGHVPTGTINIFGAAARCVELVAGDMRWTSDVVTAMVCRDLHSVPALPLPGELTVSSVQRLAGHEPGDVALEEAVAAAIYASPAIQDPPEIFAEFLRSLPPAFRLFAAVDDAGTVRATSGAGVFDEHATVIFVNTEPGWRGRGIGQAMTAHALRAARRSGATQASLDASGAGQSIYRRLGFEAAGTLTRFRSAGSGRPGRRTRACPSAEPGPQGSAREGGR